MILKPKSLYLSVTILCFAVFSGCGSSPYARTEINRPPIGITATENQNNIVQEKSGFNPTEPINDAAETRQSSHETASVSEVNKVLQEESSVENVELGDQELIDNAGEYCQAASEFLEQGDADSAIDALDKAYSFLLKVGAMDNPELLQQKEDIRITISKRILGSILPDSLP